MFIRIEPSSSVPIYRQIADQIRYQIAAGILKEGDKIPSVRELALQVAVNQNTILKVYNELCRENVLKIERGEGTYVSSSKQDIPMSERKEMIAGPLREAAVLAIQLGVPVEQIGEILKDEYNKIDSQRTKEKDKGGGGGGQSGPVCGNGKVEGGEACDPPEDPPSLVICDLAIHYWNKQCILQLVFTACGPECGDGACDQEENEAKDETNDSEHSVHGAPSGLPAKDFQPADSPNNLAK